MTRTFSGDGIYIHQRNFQQIILRGKGDGRFAETVNGEISLLPPKDNLKNDKIMRISFLQNNLLISGV